MSTAHVSWSTILDAIAHDVAVPCDVLTASFERHSSFRTDTAYIPYRPHTITLDVARIAQIRQDHGWDAPNADNIHLKLLLVISELIEAHNELRAGHSMTHRYPGVRIGWQCLAHRHTVCNLCTEPAEWGPTETAEPHGVGIELADAIMRLADIAYATGIDLQACLDDKLAYNATRPFHHGGKPW